MIGTVRRLAVAPPVASGVPSPRRPSVALAVAAAVSMLAGLVMPSPQAAASPSGIVTTTSNLGRPCPSEQVTRGLASYLSLVQRALAWWASVSRLPLRSSLGAAVSQARQVSSLLKTGEPPPVLSPQQRAASLRQLPTEVLERLLLQDPSPALPSPAPTEHSGSPATGGCGRPPGPTVLRSQAGRQGPGGHT